jgi:hypothetical protein
MSVERIFSEARDYLDFEMGASGGETIRMRFFLPANRIHTERVLEVDPTLEAGWMAPACGPCRSVKERRSASCSPVRRWRRLERRPDGGLAAGPSVLACVLAIPHVEIRGSL